MQGGNGILFTSPRLVRGNGHEHLHRLFLLSFSSAPSCLQRRKPGSTYGSSRVSGSVSSSRSLCHRRNLPFLEECVAGEQDSMIWEGPPRTSPHVPFDEQIRPARDGARKRLPLPGSHNRFY